MVEPRLEKLWFICPASESGESFTGCTPRHLKWICFDDGGE